MSTSFDADLLLNCEHEPIHAPGTIQPHGILAHIDSGGVVHHISVNCVEWFGLPAEHCVQRPLVDLIGAEAMNALQAVIDGDQHDVYLAASIKTPEGAEREAVIWHYVQESGSTIVEFEAPDEHVRHVEIHSAMLRLHKHLAQPSSLLHLCVSVTELLQDLTGFDRVMFYRFDDQWNGQVIAEARSPREKKSFLDLHFPATDIPAQARALFAQVKVRVIPDVMAPPCAIYPPCQAEVNEHALDIGDALLRSSSPIHIQYLRNMGVGGSMTLAIIVDEKLWGLLAFHHNEAHFPSPDMRIMCNTLSRIISLQISTSYKLEAQTKVASMQRRMTRLAEEITDGDSLTSALASYLFEHMKVDESQGALMVFQGHITPIGEVPPEPWQRALVDWLRDHIDPHDLFVTSRLTLESLSVDGISEDDHMPGALVIPLSLDAEHMIILLREHQLAQVTWAGSPSEKTMTRDQFGRAILEPRASFDQWREVIRGRAKEWDPPNIQFALELRNVLINGILRRADVLTRLNLELEQRNTSLESFSYIVSHDLKAPLRAIANYSALLNEDYGELLDEQGGFMLKALNRLSLRTDALLDALLEFASWSSRELPMEDLDPIPVIHELIDIHKQANPAKPLNLTIQEPLPRLHVNHMAFRQVLDNIISNAFKYNDKETLELEFFTSRQPSRHLQTDGAITPNEAVIGIRDNGIGIDADEFHTVFQLFKRLSNARQHADGTGAGLSIVEKLVGRMGGAIWLDSVEGESTTFYIALRRSVPSHR